jgi:hypothetical protein
MFSKETRMKGLMLSGEVYLNSPLDNKISPFSKGEMDNPVYDMISQLVSLIVVITPVFTSRV